MKTFAMAGASSRALYMYLQPVQKEYAETSRIMGIYDPNPIRAAYVSKESGGVPVYADFDEMLKKTKPDAVIVTTVDRYHHEYIIRALEAGCEAITEKPMTIDAEKCRAILEAEQRTQKKVTVTFNYRFTPFTTRVKEMIKEGAIGRVLSVHFEWLLDRSHGADYFRRWHSRMENSGGLLVHKATHHFDLVNWWIEDEPERVFACGDRKFYGPTRDKRGERCSTCGYQDECEFYADFTQDPVMRGLYFDAEKADGYFRDRCVFRDEIDIYDTMSLNVLYRSGVQMSYMLNAHCAYEGYRISINGTYGRLEAEENVSGLRAQLPYTTMQIITPKGSVTTIQVPLATGGHGGGDEQLQKRLFGGKDFPDPLGHMAGSHAGAMSILIGVAANQSIQQKIPIAIEHLLNPM